MVDFGLLAVSTAVGAVYYLAYTQEPHEPMRLRDAIWTPITFLCVLFASPIVLYAPTKWEAYPVLFLLGLGVWTCVRRSNSEELSNKGGNLVGW